MEYKDVPFCCKHCIHLATYEYPSFDDDSYFCCRNIKFPVKKQSCKKQKDWVLDREVKPCI